MYIAFLTVMLQMKDEHFRIVQADWLKCLLFRLIEFHKTRVTHT